ncbi:MAG: hypothetical protein M1831_002731 [Alyxoria varia]|nr:MAG: hypothetical protein M1831_002731 [Alyxoria varia]
MRLGIPRGKQQSSNLSAVAFRLYHAEARLNSTGILKSYAQSTSRRVSFEIHASPFANRQSRVPSPPFKQPQFRALRVTAIRQTGTEKAKLASRPKRYLVKFAQWIGIFVIVTSSLVVAFFVYDASTYHEGPSTVDIPVSELALNPRRGGPKNLPIIEHFIDDDENETLRAQKDKPKLVVLGAGWGSITLLKKLAPENYHVTLISPSNHFLFTPMLPSATVGTLDLRSLVEPVRRIIARVNGHFVQGTAVDVDFNEKLLEVTSTTCGGEETRFYVPYDKLVVGVGAITNPHGVKGLEHCRFLKSINDAYLIRNHVINNLEKASLPTTSDEERKRLLSFVVSGGGPTGVETAAELFDMLNEDLCHSYPQLLRNEISVHIIQSRSHILNTYEEALSKYAEQRLAHDSVDVLTNARVKEVQKDKIIFTQRDPTSGSVEEKELPMGFCLWSTGVSQNPFCAKLATQLSDQHNRLALETDTHLRLIGDPSHSVYAIGDASTVQNNVSSHIVDFLRKLARDRGKDPENLTLAYSDWRHVAREVRAQFPQASQHLRRLDKLFEQYDADHNGRLDFGELSELLKQVDSKLTSLPATAQRANQQGGYLAKKFNKISKSRDSMDAVELQELRAGGGDVDERYYKAFDYKHMGNLAYVGNAAVFDFGDGLGFSGGLMAVYLWRSVYLSESVSFRTRVLLMMDWFKRALFGRDLMMI